MKQDGIKQHDVSTPNVGAALLKLFGAYLDYHNTLEKLAKEFPSETAIPQIMEESTTPPIPETLSLDDGIALCEIGHDPHDKSQTPSQQISVYTADRIRTLDDKTLSIDADNHLTLKPVGGGEASKSYVMPDGYGVPDHDMDIGFLTLGFHRDRNQLRFVKLHSPLYNLLCQQMRIAGALAQGQSAYSSAVIRYQKLFRICEAIRKTCEKY
ncbi:TPA: hypothetical protein HA246_07085 [Candidatus Woesearchaeota archaeon]|nr:hypothetical protein [Candidatus Woesearchaeota archaeon]